VNPLVIASRAGELLDTFLRDRKPVADRNLLADAIGDP
jgi:hypothetical protein